MSDEPPAYQLDLDYLWDAYPNGVEGAHYSVAISLASILQCEHLELPGLDTEAWHQVVTNHVAMLDTFCMKMLKPVKPAPLREITKKEKK